MRSVNSLRPSTVLTRRRREYMGNNLQRAPRRPRHQNRLVDDKDMVSFGTGLDHALRSRQGSLACEPR